MEIRNNIDLMATPTEGSHIANVDYVDGKMKTITWADYQALSEDEKNDGTLYDIPDMPTAGQGGIITTYTALDQLGLNTPCTVEEIFAAMPNNSYLEIGTDVSEVTNVPDSTAGFLLTIRKYNYARFDIQAKRSSATSLADNKLYLGQLKGEDTTDFSWKTVCTTSVVDVGVTMLSVNTDFSGIVHYTVKNGICTVVVQGLTSSSAMSTSTQIIATSLPEPVVSGWYGLYSNSIVTSGYPTLLVTVRNGDLTTHIGTNGVVYYGSFSYPIKE